MTNKPKTYTTSIVVCPNCGQSIVSQMPLIEEVRRIQCPGCEKMIETTEGDCCVYCSNGSEKCPKMQLWEVLKQSLNNTL